MPFHGYHNIPVEYKEKKDFMIFYFLGLEEKLRGV
jgi:hypothetical protein